MTDTVRSDEREQRTAAEAEALLLHEASPPWRAWGVALWGLITEEDGDAAEHRVVTRDQLVGVLRNHPEDPTSTAILRDIEANPGDIPHIIQWEAGTVLSFLTPLDDGGVG